MRILRTASIILFFVLVAVLSIHSLASINQDIGRHLKSGQIIWETGNVYKTNLFSFTEPDHPFINHHWLSEVVFYLLSGLIGLKGLIIFKAGVIVTAFGLTYLALRKKVGMWPFLIAGLFGILVFSSRTDVRPEIFSYLFLAYFLFAIFRAKYPEPSPSRTIASSELRDKSASYGTSSNHKWSRSPEAIEDPRYRKAISGLYALPVVQIFWTNMHIYFALGPALLFFFLIDRYAHHKEQARFVFKIFIIACLTTLANPNFINGALAPLTILRDYGYSIVENQSIFFLTDYGIHLRDIYFFELSLVLLFLSFVFALKNRQKAVFELLAAVFFTILAGKMIRNFGLYALVFIPIVAVNFSTYEPNRFLSKKWPRIILYLFLSVFLLFLIKSATDDGFNRWFNRANRFGLAVPQGVEGGVNFVKENGITGPVFNNFDVGSFLIWKLYPQEHVFVDGRPEAYSVDFFEKVYKPMQEDPAVWKRLSEEYQINYVFFGHTDMTPWARQFLNSISQNPDWPMVYLDDSTVIFIKRTPENSEIIKKFRIIKTN